MQDSPRPPAAVLKRSFNYGWVIVAACCLIIFVTYGLIYAYAVFFKPLAEHFQWDRSSVSMVYSFAVVIRGAVSIGIGWLADKYGARKVMVFCGLMMAAGYLLSSRVTALWQFFLTYAVIEAIGMSGAWGICTAMPSRWFTRNRGLALGIATAGSGAGTLLLVPFAERLVNAYDWPQAFVICGIGAGVLVVIAGLFLRNPPEALAPSGKVSPQAGAAAEKVGLYRSLAVTCLILAAVFVALLFTRSAWVFYLLAALYGIPYGAEVTQIPLVVGRFFGTRNMATLMGMTVFGINVGGAFGAWYAGKIFDVTASYNGAFITGAVAAAGSAVMVGFLKRAEGKKAVSC